MNSQHKNNKSNKTFTILIHQYTYRVKSGKEQIVIKIKSKENVKGEFG